MVLTLVLSSELRATISTNLKLSKNDLNDLARIEKHMNSTKSMLARFLQISSNGQYSEGDLFLQRPGKLRLVYDEPNPLMVVADGTYISFIDRELEHSTTLFLRMTQASILLKQRISFFSHEFILNEFKRSSGVFRIRLIKAKEPFEGNIQLVFSNSPLELRKWIITDSQGVTTTVSLLETQINVPIDDKLFIYKPEVKIEPND